MLVGMGLHKLVRLGRKQVPLPTGEQKCSRAWLLASEPWVSMERER